MHLRKILAATAVIGIALSSLGLGVEAAAAATAKKPHHHVLVCKAGSALHLVTVKGKRVWVCHKIRHPILHMLMPMKF